MYIFFFVRTTNNDYNEITTALSGNVRKIEEMNNRIERIKRHVKEKKAVYISGIAGVIIGVSGVIVFKRLFPKVITQIQPEIMAASASVQNGLAYKPTTKIYQAVSKYGNVIGRPGKAIWDITTNKRYESETFAAMDIGVTQSRISNQLRGITDNVNGHMFTWAD